MAEQGSRAALASDGTAQANAPARRHVGEKATARPPARSGRRPRYFVVRPPERTPIEWNPPEPTAAVGYDMAYWGRVLEVMERLIEDPELTFYLVWGEGCVPSDGPRVVAIGMHSATWKRLARSSPRVRATFQAGGPRPRIAGSLRAPLVPALTMLALRGRAWARELSALPGTVSARAREGRGFHPVFAVPLGHHTAADLPLKPIAERQIGVSFAGSVKHWQGWWGNVNAKMGAPKVRSRRAMLRAIERLRRSHPELSIDVRIFDSFVDFSPDTGSYDEQTSRAYWELLMDTKVCLVPAGTFHETYRHFEALRAGCVIVTDTSLDAWYVRGAPFIEIASWDDLERVVLPLLADEAELERRHHAALECWRRQCSEEAVGRFIADRLNELASGTS